MFHHDLRRTGCSTSKAPNTNATSWKYTTDDYVLSSPAVANDRVYVGSWSGKVYCLNASTGTLIWSYATGDHIRSSPAVAGGKVFIGSYDYKIYALNASTGSFIWKYTTGNLVDSSPAVTDDRVYVGSHDKKVYCLNASTGSLIWNYTTGSLVYSSPAVADGKVYIGSYDYKVYCLNALTGAFIWSYTTGSIISHSSPAIADGRVYVGSWNGKVYALNASTGSLIWSYTTAGLIESAPAVADGKVYVGSDDKKVYCLNASTGSLIWSYTTGDYIDSSPAVADGKVYVGSRDYKVYALNASNGLFIWSFTSGGLIISSPAVADRKVYVGSYDRNIYAFGVYDVAITSVIPSPTQVLVGQTVNITVVAKNEGAETETFNVTAYYDDSVIQTQTVTNLAPSVEATLTFIWNTTGAMPIDYRIKAVASKVLGEADIADNTYVDGIVKLIDYPVAQFTYSPIVPLTGETVTFNASLSTPDGGIIISYDWNFGDGTPNATGMITTHAYTDNGTYTVTLTVTDDSGLTDTDSHNITVLNRPPIASFTESATLVPTGTVIYFNASASYDPDGYIVSYFWDFGDETNGNGVTIEHAYADNGTYTVTLTLTDNDGATATATAIKTISNRPPIVFFTENATTVYVGEVIYFNASGSYDPDGMIVNYYWDFGDGTNASGVTVPHAYADNGNYTVTLTVTDDDGMAASTSHIKTVLNRPDIAITNVTSSKTVVGQGYNLQIQVAITNQGDFTETFIVTLYANTTSIMSKIVTLTGGNSTTFAFIWSVSGFVKGNYTIWAYAIPIPDETDTLDNTCVDGVVTVAMPGDVNADGIVDLFDIVLIAAAFGSSVGQPSYISNADIYDDGKVDIFDLVVVATHFGETDP